VIVTTLEDCVWLVPFVAHAPSTRVAFMHAAIFVVTFELLAIGISLVTMLLHGSLSGILGLGIIELSCIGAGLSWILAAYLYFQARRKRLARQAASAAADTVLSTDEKGDYGSLESGNPETAASSNEVAHDDNAQGEAVDADQGAQPWLIVTLTVLGSLDEVSYFPVLILGGVFTALELCLATLLASSIILLVLYFFLAQCQPFLDILDRIPLYGIVAFFAVFLTVEVAWEMLT
jgi:hypothetical protein